MWNRMLWAWSGLHCANGGMTGFCSKNVASFAIKTRYPGTAKGFVNREILQYFSVGFPPPPVFIWRIYRSFSF